LNGKIEELVSKRDAVIQETEMLKTAAILAAAKKKGVGFNEIISVIEGDGSAGVVAPLSNDADL
jgi:malic enzyme